MFACRQIAVERELKAATLKLKKELAELKEQADYVTKLVISNRLSLASTLESQIQTSGKYQPIIALLHVPTLDSFLMISVPRLIMMVISTSVLSIFLHTTLKK